MSSVIPLFSIRYAIHLCGIALFCCASARNSAGQCHYTMTEIPNPPGWYATGVSINNRGHVAGWLSNLGETYRGFIWTPETGTQVLALPDGFYDMQVLDINDLDHAVGYAVSHTLGYWTFLWDGKSYTMIPPPPGVTGITAYGINNSDQLVGVAGNAFIWEKGELTDLGPLVNAPYGSVATAINERSEISGYAAFGQEDQSFVISGANVNWLPQDKLQVGWAYALSNNGFVVGRGFRAPFPNGRRFGLVWTPYSIETIEPPSPNGSCYFLGITDQARAVGSFYFPDYQAIVWQNGITTELSSLVEGAPHLSGALDINRWGQIIALRTNRTVLLNPIWIRGDITGDCRVTLDDLVLVLTTFGAPPGSFPRGDVNLDGQVDLKDLAILLSHWGE